MAFFFFFFLTIFFFGSFIFFIKKKKKNKKKKSTKKYDSFFSKTKESNYLLTLSPTVSGRKFYPLEEVIFSDVTNLSQESITSD